MDWQKWNTWKSFLEELSDPQFVDTSSLISKETLAPEIWEKDKMNPDVLEAAKKIAMDFFESLNLPHNVNIEDITLTGSLASYNWSDFSDFDLHILINFNKLEDRQLFEDYFKQKIRNWNNTHNIMLKGFEVEIYVQDKNEPHHSAGIYSLFENRWLKRPTLYRLEVDYDLVKEKAAKLMEEIDDVYEFYAEKQFKSALEGAEGLMERIRRYRKSGLETGGIYSVENLVFKVLRRNEYIKKLSSIKTLAYDEMMSIYEGFDYNPFIFNK